VLPYRTNAGASGVLNLARSYGRPVVISSEPGLLEQVRNEGGASMIFSNRSALVDALRKVLTSPELQRRMGEANLEVARRVTLDAQAAKMVALYEPKVAFTRAVADPEESRALAEAKTSEVALPWPNEAHWARAS
jgi:glycosyltransferase involved in cell wall biosynthesis